MKTGSMPAAEQADSYTTSGVISMIQGLHYKQVNGRDEPMLQNNKPNSKLNNKPNNKLSNKPNNKLNNKLDLKKRLFSMLLVLALLSGSVPGALPAAAVTTDGYVASETGGRSFRFCPPVPPVSNYLSSKPNRGTALSPCSPRSPTICHLIYRRINMGTVLSVLSPCSPGLFPLLFFPDIFC